VSHLVVELLLSVVPAVVAITLHEAAHGYAAWGLGDDTAKLAGRLSLNPLRHVDRVGTILLPGFLVLVQMLTIGRVAFLFGWAKPVPVNAWRFADPRRGMALVAAAGPAMNFLLAWLAALCFHGFFLVPDRLAEPVAETLQMFMLINLVLGLFNLLPIPPMDGGRIMVGILPLRLAQAWARLERAGLAIVLILILVLPQLGPSFGIYFDPVHDLLERLLPWALRLVMSAAGFDV
jgi:Zn-dependent protease